MKTKEILQPLVNLPLWSMGRAGTMQWTAFGVERTNVTLRDGTSKLVSEYALHIQCAWRVRHRHQIIVASGDRGYPAGKNPYADVLAFNWDKQGENQLDERASKFIEEHRPSPLVVNAAEADESGNIWITLNHEYYLEVFPENSIIGEYWRFFRPYREEEHFVFTKEGIRRE